jgi:hypothetical protein
VLLAAFALFELRLARSPLLRFGLFRSRSVSAANGVMLLIGAIFFSMWYFLSLYLQNVLGYGPLKTGFAFLPMSAAIIFGAQSSSRLISKLGVRPLLQAGTAVAAAGFWWMSLIHADSSYAGAVLGPAVLIALALGLLFTPLAAAATSGVPHAEAGLASGVLNTSRQVGGSVGLAVLATIAIDRTHSLLAAHGAAVRPAMTGGYARAFLVAAFVSLAAFVSAVIVPSIRGSQPAGTGPGEPTGSDAAEAVVGAEESALPHLDTI